MEAMDQNGIDACLCYPANSNIGIEAEREKHREVKDFFKRYPERVFGICCVNPHYDEETYFGEVRRYIGEGFRGISANPQVHAFDPLAQHCEKVFAAARELDVPVFVYVTVGLPFGKPMRLYELCEKYRDVSTVLVHSGEYFYQGQFNILGQEFENIYFEMSLGGDMRAIKKYVDMLGAERILFASETLPEIPYAMYMFRENDLTDKEKEACLGGSAARLLKLKERYGNDNRPSCTPGA